MKYRKHNFYDPRANVAMFGIQIEREGSWRNCVPLYLLESDRDDHLKALRKEARAQRRLNPEPQPKLS